MERLDKEYKKNDSVLSAIKVAIAEKALSDGIVENGFDPDLIEFSAYGEINEFTISFTYPDKVIHVILKDDHIDTSGMDEFQRSEYEYDNYDLSDKFAAFLTGDSYTCRVEEYIDRKCISLEDINVNSYVHDSC